MAVNTFAVSIGFVVRVFAVAVADGKQQKKHRAGSSFKLLLHTCAKALHTHNTNVRDIKKQVLSTSFCKKFGIYGFELKLHRANTSTES